MTPAALLLTLLTASPSPPDCASALRATGGAKICVAAAGGVALTATRERAAELSGLAETGAARFRTTFGRDPVRYAVWEFDDPAALPSARTELRGGGFEALLPIPSQALAAGAPPPVAGVRVRREGVPDGEPRGDSSFVPHELGHQWYAAAFWRDAPRPPGDRYGSPAPDWLDEAAAIALEDAARAAAHRRRLADGRSADPAVADGVPPEIPLAEFLVMSHPAAALLPKTSNPGPVQVMGSPSLFYSEARVFTDYLSERSGDARILAVISEGLRRTGALDAWLPSDGVRHRLPGNVTLMEADWRAWLDAHYGVAHRAADGG